MTIMTTITGRTCNICGDKITGGLDGLIAHGSDHHPNHYLSGAGPNGETKGRMLEFVEKNYWCPLDQKWYSSRKHLARTIKAHGMTNEQYFLEHGEAHMPKEWAELTLDPKYGTAAAKPPCLQCGTSTKFNEGKWCYPVFCGFSCSAKWHADNTDRVERAQATLKARQADDPTHNLRPNQEAYWTARGHTPEEAKALVSERQRAGTLERMIEKHGGEEGARLFNEGLTRRKEAIHKSEMFKGGSKVSRDFFDEVQDLTEVPLVYGDNEECVWCSSVFKNIWVDCLNREQKKIIEFYGDFWHASPRKYKADDVLFETKGVTAKDIWEKDERRVKALRDNGYDVLIIWEDDYRANPDWALVKALSFLEGIEVAQT